MGARGRKPKTELTLVQRSAEILTLRRPPAPLGLSDEAAAEWREVVASCEPDHFGRASYPVLEAYCCHAVAARRIMDIINNLDEEKDNYLVLYDRLLVMHERESRALASHAVRLGIACATRISKPAAFTAKGSSPKPWDKQSR